jgi:hypothetical protein
MAPSPSTHLPIDDPRPVDPRAASELEALCALSRFPDGGTVTVTDVLATALVAVVAVWAA